MKSTTRAQRQQFHTEEMKARRERQLAHTPGFTPQPQTGIRAHAGPKEKAPQPFRVHENGDGYDTYHATKGWRRVSGKRLEAQARMENLLHGRPNQQQSVASNVVSMMKRAFANQPDTLAA